MGLSIMTGKYIKYDAALLHSIVKVPYGGCKSYKKEKVGDKSVGWDKDSHFMNPVEYILYTSNLKPVKRDKIDEASTSASPLHKHL